MKKQTPLREWQKNALAKAMGCYENAQRHFMCVAAPGAGKSRFSAELARACLLEGRIDYVLFFAPSVAVAAGIAATFISVLNDPFDGKMGSKGKVVTYQAIQYSFDELAYLIKNFRVLIISDEIHHCSSGSGSLGNQWGEKIDALTQLGSPLTLTMSGTPWRSNQTKIALQTYTGEPEELHIDFIYGLGDAVLDKVCRSPNLVLLDNDLITVTEKSTRYRFKGIGQAIEAGKLKYGELLIHSDSLFQLVSHAHQELISIRRSSPRAAGLVVASSIMEAQRIAQLIEQNFKQTTVLVSYDQLDAHQKIQSFQNSNADWIVSIGMVSEGTDIPRLQVCAYLSNVRTELYYRQVLGRILRINEHPNERCSLIAFAEPKLVEFSERINQDLPSDSMTIKEYPAIMIDKLVSNGLNTQETEDSTSISIEPSRLNSPSIVSSGDGALSFNTIKMILCEDSYRTTILSL